MDNSNDGSDPSDGSDPQVSPDHDHKLNLIQAFLKHYSDKETESGGMSMPTAEEQEEMVLLTAKRDRDGNSLLHLAIKENQAEVFNQIVGECNVDAENNRGERPLHCAVADNRIEFALALIENGATVNVEDKEGKTPLHLALKNQNVLLAEILFDSHAVMSKEYLNKFKPLYCAAQSGNLEIVKLLMTNGCKTVDSYEGDYSCPLVAAVRQGHLEVVKYLMRKGDKDIKTITVDRFHLLSSCVKPERVDIFKYLVDVGVKAEGDFFWGASFWKRYNIWKYLLTSTSKMNAYTCSQETELHWAIRSGQLETVKVIVNNPASYFKSNSLTSQLAVHIAVENGNEDILEFLLNEGFSFEGCFSGVKPLHVAATFNNTRLVELLLEAGADINSIAVEHLTPLHFAASAIQPTVVKFLLENGADPSKTCRYGSSSLKFALDMLTGLFEDGPTITTVMYEKLLKVMEILIPKVEITPEYWHYAIKMKISRDKSDLNSYGQKSNDASKSEQDGSNLQFQLAMIKVIFNYLKEDQVESLSLSALNGKEDKSIDSPELLQIVMEYNDFKSCSDIEIRLWKNSYECNLLLISYADSVKNLTNIDVEFKNDASFQLHGKDKTVFLKLIVARLVLIINKYNSKVSKFGRKHNLNDWRKECGKQKVSLQNTKVDENLNITFYNVLTSPVSKFATFTGNENFLQSIASSYTKFPAYAEFLKVSIDKGKTRNDLMDNCVNHMFNLVGRSYKIRISKFDIGKIFQYLSVFDLRRFSAACSKSFFRL
ncbi:ankyrin-3-like [Leptopilina heterotoma]|uniref:ankyrin-3-like n=1 Tax=Leptopilina heterotoma TaxID=63436 RepID=UPI001CA96052|nr:ankyrin-3-like [Leptopilina heterotoma]